MRQGAFEPVLLVGTRLRGRHHGQRLMCAAPTGRTHGRTDQPKQDIRNTLANGGPSTHGAKRTWLSETSGRPRRFAGPFDNLPLSRGDFPCLDEGEVSLGQGGDTLPCGGPLGFAWIANQSKHIVSVRSWRWDVPGLWPRLSLQEHSSFREGRNFRAAKTSGPAIEFGRRANPTSGLSSDNGRLSRHVVDHGGSKLRGSR